MKFRTWEMRLFKMPRFETPQLISNRHPQWLCLHFPKGGTAVNFGGSQSNICFEFCYWGTKNLRTWLQLPLCSVKTTISMGLSIVEFYSNASHQNDFQIGRHPAQISPNSSNLSIGAPKLLKILVLGTKCTRVEIKTT